MNKFRQEIKTKLTTEPVEHKVLDIESMDPMKINHPFFEFDMYTGLNETIPHVKLSLIIIRGVFEFA